MKLKTVAKSNEIKYKITRVHKLGIKINSNLMSGIKFAYITTPLWAV